VARDASRVAVEILAEQPGLVPRGLEPGGNRGLFVPQRQKPGAPFLLVGPMVMRTALGGSTHATDGMSGR
jgi:hypothetical protein